MPRGMDAWSSIGSALGRVLADPPPAWVRSGTVAQLEAALAMLRADALTAIGDADTSTAPTLLGMGRTLYMASRAPGGWLATVAPRRWTRKTTGAGE